MIKKYRPVFTGTQLVLLRNSLLEYINSSNTPNREELIKVFKIISNAATNAELEVGAAYSSAQALSLESKLCLDDLEIKSESQLLMEMSETERKEELDKYQEQLLREFGI